MSVEILKMRAPVLACGFWVAIAIAQSAHAKINVVVSIKPIHSLVAGVMRGVGSPDLLLEAGSPHNYALKPSNARALQNADVVFWVGPELETFLAGALRQQEGKTLIVPLKKTKWLTLLDLNFRQKRPKKYSHRQKKKSIDPHIWLDPDNARAMVVAIADVLARKDLEHKNIYWTNAKKMIARLDLLTSSIQRSLAPLRERPYLTFHDDFLYFERRFNLTYAGSITSLSGARPGVRHLKDLKIAIKNKGIKCVFVEPQFNPKLAELIVEGSKVKMGMLDPLGARLKKGPELYFSLLKNNARAFVSCLGK